MLLKWINEPLRWFTNHSAPENGQEQKDHGIDHAVHTRSRFGRKGQGRVTAGLVNFSCDFRLITAQCC